MRNAVTTQRIFTQRIFIFGKLAVAAVTALAIAAAAPLPAHAQGEENESKVEEGLYSCGKARGKVSVSFKPDVELKDLITWAMGFTCKNFVFSSSIGGRSAKVTIMAPKKMSARQAWQVFLVAMQTMNLTIVPQGNVLRIIESAQAKNEPLPLYRKGHPGATSQLVRIIIRPGHIPPEDLATALSAMKSKEGAISSIPKAGILVVTDYGSVISKMRSLVKEIDQPVVGERLYMIRIKHADATELASKLQEILGTGKSTSGGSKGRSSSSRNKKRTKKPKGLQKSARSSRGSDAEVASALPSKIIADERTNSLIILANEPAYLRVRSLVKRLDVAIGGESQGRIHVYYLRNADAEEMAQTLTAVISGISQSSGSSSRNPRSRTTDSSRSSSGSSSSAPAFEGQVRITQDKPTNSLVVIASAKDFLSLRDVIEKLDTPRMQVFIEAVILEVKADNSRDFGTSFHGGVPTDDGAVLIGGLQHNSLQSLVPATLIGSSGLLGGLLGPLLNELDAIVPGASIPSFGVLFQALATSNNVNVLSSPHILTTNNEEAEISVGENIPYQLSFSSLGGAAGGAAGGFGFPVQSVQRQDVALTLKITPHINASDMVRLEIDQEISDIASPDFGGLGPSWAKRTIKTTVVVRDQQSIVIGGLMSDRVIFSESKIPLLGDVPLFGYLFKYTKKQKAKTNLLVLLTPYVIKDQMDIEQIVQRKVRERREFVNSFSNLQGMTFNRQIDYRRKRGLIEEINRTVLAVERDVQILREAEMIRTDFQDGMIEYSGEDEDSTSKDKSKDKSKSGAKDSAKGPSEDKSGDKSGERAADKKTDGAEGKAAAKTDTGKAGKRTAKASRKAQ